MEKIEIFLKNFISSFQVAKIYTTTHPNFTASADKAFKDLQNVLAQRGELTIGIVGEELTADKEIFFDLSRKTKDFITYLKLRGIEKMAFFRGIEKEELIRLISSLVSLAESEEGKDITLSFKGVRNIAVGKIKVPSTGEEKIRESLNYLNLYKESLGDVTKLLTSVAEKKVIEGGELKVTMVEVMTKLLDKYQEFFKLTAVKRHDVGTFIHLLNVSILSMYFSSKLKFSKDVVYDMGIAALFHDIGKIHISRRIIDKIDRLSAEEFSQIKSHTILGAEILLEYTDALGELPVVVAFEHHLRYDMSGYPKAPFAQRLHLASLIISLCDVYDALNQRRTYKQAYPPDMIYNLMMREKERLFHPQLLDSFFKIMGVWPRGTIIQLSDGRVAVVREENSDDIFSPKVEVISPEDKKEFVNLKEKKAVKIERFLNPFSEGEKYLSLI